MNAIFSRTIVAIHLTFLSTAAVLSPNASWAATPDATRDSPGTQAAETINDPAHPLADSHWKLVNFQSMSDEIGVIEPNDPSRFTMRLNRDGTVTMRLDCNLANGTWRAESGGDGVSGSFEFGPLASTRALCPPPHLDERIVRDAQYVRGFLLRDGRIYLSLMADAGIYAWEPVD
jgi:heat shock protein HslJ